MNLKFKYRWISSTIEKPNKKKETKDLLLLSRSHGSRHRCQLIEEEAIRWTSFWLAPGLDSSFHVCRGEISRSRVKWGPQYNGLHGLDGREVRPGPTPGAAPIRSGDKRRPPLHHDLFCTEFKCCFILVCHGNISVSTEGVHCRIEESGQASGYCWLCCKCTVDCALGSYIYRFPISSKI